MIKGRKSIARAIATAMFLSTFTNAASALEPRATVNSSLLAGQNRAETAVKVSESFGSATHAVIINGDKGLVDALTATPYASLKKAPILISEKDKLAKETKDRLTKLGVKTVDLVGGEAVISKAVEDELKSMKITVNRIFGSDRYGTALAVANEIHKISPVTKVAVVNGATGLADAVSIAAPAADNNMPILLSNPSTGMEDSKTFMAGKNITKSYVVGQTAAVSDTVMNSLPGTKTRLGGTDRHDTNAKVIKEFYTDKKLDNIYVAKSGYVKNNEELVDALTVGVLAAKNDDPVLIVGNSLGTTQQTLLEGKEFEKITQVGNGIPAASINAIKDTQKDPEAKVTGVTLVDYKTIKIAGSELGRITSSNITMSGNTVASYVANSAGTEATIVFNNTFKDGTNTVTVKSNLGTSTNHTFTYAAGITTVEATTTKVKTSGIQYLEFTVNGGQKRTIEELKSLGWTVNFNSNESIFYSERSTVSGSKPAYTDTTSTTGKLKTTLVNEDVHTYEVVLTKGTETIKSGLKAFEVTDNLNTYESIKSFDITLSNGVKIASKTLVMGDIANISNIIAIDKDKNETVLSGSTFTSSNPSVISVNASGQLTTNSLGSTTITVKNGDLSKEVIINVKDEARKVSSASVDRSAVKMIIAKSEDVIITVKDQYGDPFKGKSFGATEAISTTSSPSTQIATGTFKNLDNTTPALSDNEGKLKISITGDNKGTATLQLKEDTKVLSSVRVDVSDALVANSWTLTKLDQTKDSILDVYEEENDKTLQLSLKGYNGGYFIGDEESGAIYNTPNTPEPTTGFWVKSSDESIVGVTGAINNITVTAKKAGSATIQAYKDKKLISSVSITVKDTTPSITAININEITNITTSGTITFDVESLLNTTFVKGSSAPAPTYDRTIVSGLTLSGTTEEVLLGNVTSGGVTRPILFIDKGTKNGTYEAATDLILASITVINDFGETVNNNKTIAIGDNKTGNIIVSIHKGVYNSTKAPFIVRAITVNTTN